MPGLAASGPLQRPLLVASSSADVVTTVHVDPVQGSTTGQEAAGPHEESGGVGSTTSSVRQPKPVQRSVCWRLGEWLDAYAEALETKPLRTKCVTSAVLGGLGDILAQGTTWAFGGDALWGNANAVWQTVAVSLQTMFFTAPFLHFAYDALERWIPTDKSLGFAIAQVAIDVFVLDPVLALAFIVIAGLLEGQSFGGDIVPTIKDDYLTLIFWLTVTGLVVAPIQVYLFKRFPLKWRVLIADGKDLLWTIVACFVIET